MAEGDSKESNISTIIPEQKPINIQSNILQKKKSNFEITSIRSIKSEVVNVSTADDELEDSELYDNNDSALNANDSTVVSNEEQEKTEVTTNGHNVPPTSRFRVIIDVNGKTFKRGRWNCRDYLEKRQDVIKSDAPNDMANDDNVNNEDSNTRHQQQQSQPRQSIQPPVPLVSPTLQLDSQNLTITETQQHLNSVASDCNTVKGNDGTQQQNAFHYTEDTSCESNDVASSMQSQYLQPTMQNIDQLSQIETKQQPTIVLENEANVNSGNINGSDIPGISVSSDVNNINGSNEDVCMYTNSDITNVNNTVTQAPAIINNVSEVVNNIGTEGIKEEELNDMIQNQVSPSESNITTNTTSTENVVYPNMPQTVDNNFAPNMPQTVDNNFATPILTENGAQISAVTNVSIVGNYLPQSLPDNNFSPGKLNNPVQPIQDNNFSGTVVNNAVLAPQHRLFKFS